MLKKVVMFLIISAALVVPARMVISYFEPQISMDLAVQQTKMNSTDAQAALRAYGHLQGLLYAIPMLIVIGLGLLIFRKDISRLIKAAKGVMSDGPGTSAKSLLLLISLPLLLLPLSLTACAPYNTPEYFDANTNQSVFVVPLDGDFMNQGKLDSVQAYEERKVMAKRIQITKRWLQTGYRDWWGKWIPNVRLFVVDRTPVPRHWTAGKETGTTGANQSFRLQSQDGVRFTVEYDCTAAVLDEESAKFLYFYPTGEKWKDAKGKESDDVYIATLVKVMDDEVWTMVQIASSEFSAGKNMEALKAAKAEMNIYVREKVTAVFKERGVTITTLGIAGDFNYVTDAVQKAIDQIFQNQQKLKGEQANLDSMKNKIARMTSEGIAESNKAEQEATGEAEKIINAGNGQVAVITNAAQGQALAIKALAEACKKADANPLFIPTKLMQIEAARVKKWEGQSPVLFLGASNGTTNLVNLSGIVDNAIAAANAAPPPAAAPAAPPPAAPAAPAAPPAPAPPAAPAAK